MSAESGFKIERKVSGGSFTQIDTVAANTTSYSDTTVGEGTEYTYRVRAFNAAGNSGFSNEASATTPISQGRVVMGSVLLSKTSNQTFTSGVAAEITWQEEIFDNGGFWSSGNAIIIPSTFNGMYAQVFAGARWANVTTTTTRMLQVLKNGSTFVGGASARLGSVNFNSRSSSQILTPPIQVSTGDEFTLQALQASGSDLALQNNANTYFGLFIIESFSGALVTRATPVSVANNTLEHIEWDSEVIDTGGFFTLSNASRLTIPASGVSRVRVYGGVQWESRNGAGRFLNIDKNGGSFPGGGINEYLNGDGESMQNVATPVLEVSPGDYFEIQVRQNSGIALDIEAAGPSYFCIEVIDT
jgi:hypothetical protein